MYIDDAIAFVFIVYPFYNSPFLLKYIHKCTCWLYRAKIVEVIERHENSRTLFFSMMIVLEKSFVTNMHLWTVFVECIANGAFEIMEKVKKNVFEDFRKNSQRCFKISFFIYETKTYKLQSRDERTSISVASRNLEQSATTTYQKRWIFSFEPIQVDLRFHSRNRSATLERIKKASCGVL